MELKNPTGGPCRTHKVAKILRGQGGIMQVGIVRVFRATQDPNRHKSPDGGIEKT